jgi:hypothetical protein
MIAMSAIPASPTSAPTSTTNPPQLSDSGEKYESNKLAIETNYIELREFISGLILIAVGFLAGFVFGKRK